ncbi:hypothetical protein D3C87_1289700 [compost metagenome]
MRGIQRDRRQHRTKLAREEVARPLALVVGPGVGQVKKHAFLLERGEDHVLQHVILRGHKPLCALRDELIGLEEGETIGRQARCVIAHLLLQPRHADFKKLVQIAGDDADELQPFQQRYVGVGGLRQHARIEFQNAKLAVQQRAGRRRHHV